MREDLWGRRTVDEVVDFEGDIVLFAGKGWIQTCGCMDVIARCDFGNPYGSSTLPAGSTASSDLALMLAVTMDSFPSRSLTEAWLLSRFCFDSAIRLVQELAA